MSRVYVSLHKFREFRKTQYYESDFVVGQYIRLYYIQEVEGRSSFWWQPSQCLAQSRKCVHAKIQWAWNASTMIIVCCYRRMSTICYNICRRITQSGFCSQTMSSELCQVAHLKTTCRQCGTQVNRYCEGMPTTGLFWNITFHTALTYYRTQLCIAKSVRKRIPTWLLLQH